MTLKTKRALLIAYRFSLFALGCTMLFFIGYGVVQAIGAVKKKCVAHKTEMAGEILTDNLRTRILKDGRVAVLVSPRKIVGKYDQVFAQDYGSSIYEIFINSSWGSVQVRNNGLYGYIHPVSGEVLMEPQFIMAWESDPVSGLAACLNDKHKLGFVNIETGQTAIPFQFEIDSTYLHPYSSYDYPFFDFIFRDGLSLIPGSGGKVGLINANGEIVLPVEYDDVIVRDYGFLSHSLRETWYSPCCDDGVLTRDYNNNYDFDKPVILKQTDSTGQTRYGVFDKNGIVNVPTEYDQISFVDCDGEVLFLCQKDGIIKGLDKNGRFTNGICFSCEYDESGAKYTADISVLSGPDRNPSPYISYRTLNGIAVMDTDFRVVVEPDDYIDIEYLGDGVFSCEKSEEYGVILKDYKVKRL